MTGRAAGTLHTAVGPSRRAVIGSDRVIDAASLYLDLAPAVRSYLRAQGVRDADNLLGEVFFHVARSIDKFRGDADDARRWVFTIAHHRLVDHRRRLAVRPVEVWVAPPDRPAPIDVEASLDPELLTALAELTDQQREVVLLRFVADLSLHEVARITGRPVGAVKAMQARALARLASLLGSPS